MFNFLGIFCCPVLLIALVYQQWILGWTTCSIYTVVISASINTSIMTLCLVSLDRLMAVIKPFKYRAQDTFTQRRSSPLIIGGWVHSVFWAVAPIIGWGEIVSEPNTHTCKPNWSADGFKNRSYSLGLGTFCFAAPVVTTVVVYIFIYHRSRTTDKLIAKAISLQSRIRQEQQRAVLITVLTIIGTFCCCWLLYTVVTTWKFVSHQVPPNWLVQLGLMLALSNSCANPIIYAIRDRRLRTTFAKLFYGCLGNKRDNFKGNLVGKFSNTGRLNTSFTHINTVSRSDMYCSKSTLNVLKEAVTPNLNFSTFKTPLNSFRDQTEFELYRFDLTSNNVKYSPETSL